DPTDHAFSFDDGQYLVDGGVGNDLTGARRPQNLESIDPSGLAKSEVDPQILLTKVARPGLHFSHLCAAACRDAEPRADRVAIAARSDETQEEPHVASAGVVAQQIDGSTVVGDEEI